MSLSRFILHPSSFCLLVALAALTASPARAADPEGCLTCHQYRGLAKLKDDGKSIALAYVNPNYYSQALGPHARLRCTDCHVRAEVEVYPHKPATPVDCGKTCHLDSPGKVETRFSHERVGHMLDGSAHTPQVLKKSNALLDEPLRPGQSSCLLCHDEPAFNRTAQSWAQAELPLNRCNTCHDGQLPVDTRHMFSHVTARSVPARTNQDMVRVCALCHANEKVRAEFKLPNSVTSYLNSFHGKASLLGSQETANCLDCHVAPLQNAHSMLSRTNLDSSANPLHLPDTCRSPACHQSAGERISMAAMHLDLPSSRGIEYGIACVFVLLIVFTFGPSLLITLLKLVQIIVGRRDPKDEHYHHLATKLLAVPGRRAELQRFDLHQRVQHWFLAVTFILLVLTGFPMKFADRPWAAKMVSSLFGSLPTARLIHHVCGTLLVIGFVYHLTYVLLTLRRNLKTGKAEGRKGLKGIVQTVLGLPMAITPRDSLQMGGLVLYLLGLKKHRPTAGRFNPEEKFEYIGVFWGTFVLGTTGVLMWFNGWTTRHMTGRVLTIATLVHTFEAFLALLHVGIVHMASVIFSPGVFPVSTAMFTGHTPTEELVEGHAAMLDAVGSREAETASVVPASTEAAHA